MLGLRHKILNSPKTLLNFCSPSEIDIYLVFPLYLVGGVVGALAVVILGDGRGQGHPVVVRDLGTGVSLFNLFWLGLILFNLV